MIGQLAMEKEVRAYFRAQYASLESRVRGLVVVREAEVSPISPIHEDASSSSLPWLLLEAKSALDSILEFVFKQTSPLLSASFKKHAPSALVNGADSALKSTGFSKLHFAPTDPRIADYLEEHGAELIKGINETTRERVSALVNKAIEDRWSAGGLARELQKQFKQFSEERAKLIARAEMGQAHSHGALTAMRDIDKVFKMRKSWVTVGDQRVSEGCRENERKGWIGVEGEFPSGHQAPLRTPRCRCYARFERARAK